MSNEEIVEIDAIDGAEWDRDRHTPRAPEGNLAALVRQTATVDAPLPPSKRAGTEPKRMTTTATTPRLRKTPPPVPVVAPPPAVLDDVDDAWDELPKERVPVAALQVAPLPLPLPAPPPEPAPPPPLARDSMPSLATMPARDSQPAMPSWEPSRSPSEREPKPLRVDLAPLQSRRTRRALAIAALAVATLVAVIVIAALAGEAPDRVATALEPTPPQQPAAPPPAPPPAAIAAPAIAPVADDTKPSPPPPPPARTPARRRAAAAKPVVLDYDKAAPAPPAAHPDDALARARAAYTLGNRHLFAGETTAAVAAYRQALAAYPNYAAGYRGLGLAYAQASDRAAAVTAFKTYVTLVPKARDIALIQKRIAALSHR